MLEVYQVTDHTGANYGIYYSYTCAYRNAGFNSNRRVKKITGVEIDGVVHYPFHCFKITFGTERDQTIDRIIKISELSKAELDLLVFEK